MRKRDEYNGSPHDAAVDSLVRALKKTEVADEQCDLEEADAHLVDWSAGVVDAGEEDFALYRAVEERQA